MPHSELQSRGAGLKSSLLNLMEKMMTEKLHVGYIGWLMHDETDFCTTRAVCDINEEQVERYVAKHPDVTGYTDYRKMASDPDLDAVVISTPNWLHCEMACCFLEEDKHVFCEKPMGINREEMNEMLLADRDSDGQLAIDFEMRASSGTRRVKKIVDSGEIGAPVGIEFVHHRGCWLPEGSGKWRLDPDKSGGLYFMEVCHEVDFMRWILGEVTHVQSFKTPNVLPQYQKGMPDNVFTHLFFEDGAMSHIATGHALSSQGHESEEYEYPMGHDMYFVFTGEEGAIRLDAIRNEIFVVKLKDYPASGEGKRPEHERTEELSDPAACHDIGANRRAFLKACAEGRPHLQDAEDAWRSHAVCLAAEKSAREDFQKIEVDYTVPDQE
ncbi:MAG: Gfo/Idh/MocA family oxidoreductase [Planctomycetes bacterium]|nr:Gfo/Idh/MocA family oxidoreductase [Planctomycetota bacterium]